MVANGNKTYDRKILVSIISNKQRRKTSTIIRTDFIAIPIPIEKPTNPFLYSFLIG
jgi:hypothetical protein